ncbi:MAG: ATP-grasp domain-containing protein [Anaerolineae bacterium]
MARLHEYQGKQLLQAHKIRVPKGSVVSTPQEARSIAEQLNGAVMVKAQAWVTGRADVGGIRRAETPAQAEQVVAEMLGMKIKGFVVKQVLVEEALEIEREFFASLIIDDRGQAPLMMFSGVGGTGIEEIAAKHPDKVARTHIDVVFGFQDYQARNLVRRTGIGGRLQRELGSVLTHLYEVAALHEARSVEINPLVLTADGKLYAADCRVTIDDYAVFRHPEMDIPIAREYDRPPTELEKIAYQVEANDYRGTFYFIQMAEDFEKGEGYIGFHGAGGGGSMMSMDAVLRQGYKIATFVDTSGNPPASKVYRAAKIIMAVGPIDGYFGSGSGVASQEQFHSARGLVKAFLEAPLDVPAVIRLGGNAEDKAVEILEAVNAYVPAPVEGYKKDDSPDFCAERLDTLIKKLKVGKLKVKSSLVEKREAQKPYRFETVTEGTVTYDHAVCADCETKVCVEACVPQILELNNDGVPVLNISREEAKRGGCIECLACEVDCFLYGAGGGCVDLPIQGLE